MPRRIIILVDLERPMATQVADRRCLEPNVVSLLGAGLSQLLSVLGTWYSVCEVIDPY